MNDEYERPTMDTVLVGDILIERANGGIRYLFINEKTERSIVAESKDGNYKCTCPFIRFSEVVVLKGLSLLVGEAVDSSFVDAVKNDMIIRMEHGSSGEVMGTAD